MTDSFISKEKLDEVQRMADRVMAIVGDDDRPDLLKTMELLLLVSIERFPTAELRANAARDSAKTFLKYAEEQELTKLNGAAH
jgi:hypothetical protein